MPLVDMSLEKLKEYQGTNPCPADFDEFWDKSLAELDAIDPDAKFEKYDFPSFIADAYHLTFTSTKGARIYAKFMKPKAVEGKIPAVLLFHGLARSSGDWKAMLPYVSQGYAVAFMDVRGQGGYSEDVGGAPGTTYTTPFMRGFDGDPSDMYYRNVYLDTAQLARVVMALDYVDETRVGATGESQGGALTLACAALTPGLKLCAPIYPYLCDYKRVWDMDLDVGAYEGMRYYLRHFDPLHEHIDEFFLKLGYIDIQFLAKRVKAKVLMSVGLLDNTCPPSTQFSAYNKITAEKDLLIYPDYCHEWIKGNIDKIFEFMAQL